VPNPARRVRCASAAYRGSIGGVPRGPQDGIDEQHVLSPDCWVHDAVEVRLSPIEGHGLFSRRDLPAGTVVARLGGRLVSDQELDVLIAGAERDPDHRYVDSIAVDDGTNLLIRPGQSIHFGNHSCDPNLWHIDAFTLAAKRGVVAGEELTIDYATQTANPKVRINCHCRSSLCRGTVTGEDWRLGELRERYGDHWVPAVLRRIAASTPDLLSVEGPRREGATIDLRPVQELASTVSRVLERLRHDLDQLVPGVEFEHIGATSLPDGFTKGDVDVNLRVGRERFDQVVAALSRRFELAQPQNWTSTYASFADDRRDLPVGIQVTVEGSDEDFLVMLRDRLRNDARLRQRYNRIKQENAPAGEDAYWRAKNDLLRQILE
jgi:GrpB-like predicted nucleotidyltransferase (UPF0157 family)